MEKCAICEEESDSLRQQTECQIVPRGTNRGTAILIDWWGYTYTVRKRGVYSTNWQCTERPELCPCRATVTQWDDGSFERGRYTHRHALSYGARIKARIESRVREEAATDPFKPASEIVEQVLQEELPHAPCPSLPRPEYLEGIADRFRQKLRSADYR